MNRRDFVSFSGLLTAAIAGERLPFASALPKMNLPLPAAGFLPQNNSSIKVRVTSEFMEDYVNGVAVNWRFGAGIPQTAYQAKDGSQQFFLTGMYFDGQRQIARIFPSSTSITGWDVQWITVPQTGMAGPERQLPSVQVLTGKDSAHDVFYLYMQHAILRADLAADGTVGPLGNIAGKHASTLLAPGQSRPGTRYAPEIISFTGERSWQSDPNPASADKHGTPLRDMLNPTRLYTSESEDLGMVMTGSYGGMQVYPLFEEARELYRCVMVNLQHEIVYLLLQLDESKPMAPVFRVKDRQVTGHTDSGLIYVNQLRSGHFEVIAMELPGGTVVTGSYTPGSPDKATINTATPAKFTLGNFHPEMLQADRKWTLTGTPNPHTQTLELFLLSQDLTTTGLIDLWSTTRRGDGSWEPIGPVDRNCHSADPYPTHSLSILLSKEGSGFEVLTRGEGGEWQSSAVRLPVEDSTPVSASSYRVGVHITSSDIALGGVQVKVTSSAPAPVLLGSRQYSLSTDRHVTVTTNSNGVAWFTVLLESRLSFPKLILASQRFTDNLHVDLNHSVEDFFTNLSEDKLRKARDPRTGASLVTKPENVPDAVQAIHDLMKHEHEVNHAGLLDHEGQIPLRADLPARWIPASTAREYRHAYRSRGGSPVCFAPGHAWQLEVVEGRAIHRRLSSEQAKLQMAALNQSLPQLHTFYYGFFSNLWDSLSGAARSAYQGVVTVVNTVVDGANYVAKLVVNGLEFVFNGIMDTVERVMDMVTMVLDTVGFVLGTALNWILEQLGFLFDWKEIKRRRNTLKRLLYDHSAAGLSIFPDPTSGLKTMIGGLEQARTVLGKWSSAPGATKPFGTSAHALPSLPDLFSLSGVSVLPQVTWLMDKLGDRFFHSFLDDPGISVPGFQAAQATSLRAMGKGFDAVRISMDDLQQLFLGLLSSVDNFGAATLQPIVDLLLRKIDALILLVEDVARSVIEMLNVMKNNPGAFVGWFDTTIHIPFLSGFYRGLTGNTLSVLDALCLVMSITTVVTQQPIINAQLEEPERLLAPTPHLELAVGHGRRRFLQANGVVIAKPVNLAMAASPTLNDNGRNAYIAALTFMSIGTLLAALDATVIALGRLEVTDYAQYGNNLEQFARVIGISNLLMNIGAGICMAIVARESSNADDVDKAVEIAAPILLVSGLALGWLTIQILDSTVLEDPNFVVSPVTGSGRTKGILTDLGVNALNIYLLVRAVQKGSDKQIAATSFSLTQSLLVAAVRQYVEKTNKTFLPPYGPEIVGGVTLALKSVQTGLTGAVLHELT